MGLPVKLTYCVPSCSTFEKGILRTSIACKSRNCASWITKHALWFFDAKHIFIFLYWIMSILSWVSSSKFCLGNHILEITVIIHWMYTTDILSFDQRFFLLQLLSLEIWWQIESPRYNLLEGRTTKRRLYWHWMRNLAEQSFGSNLDWKR